MRSAFILHLHPSSSRNTVTKYLASSLSNPNLHHSNQHRGLAKRVPRQDLFYFLKDVFFFFWQEGLWWVFITARKLSRVAVHGLPIAVASLVAGHSLQGTGSVAVAHGTSCSAACGIFLDQESNQFPLTLQGGFLHWTTKEAPQASCKFPESSGLTFLQHSHILLHPYPHGT